MGVSPLIWLELETHDEEVVEPVAVAVAFKDPKVGVVAAPEITGIVEERTKVAIANGILFAPVVMVTNPVGSLEV